MASRKAALLAKLERAMFQATTAVTVVQTKRRLTRFDREMLRKNVFRVHDAAEAALGILEEYDR